MITTGKIFNSSVCEVGELNGVVVNMGIYDDDILPILYIPNAVFTFLAREIIDDNINLYTAVLSTDYPLVYNHGCYGSRYKDYEYRTTEVALRDAYKELLKEGVVHDKRCVSGWVVDDYVEEVV
jgi:hypothetical protein